MQKMPTKKKFHPKQKFDNPNILPADSKIETKEMKKLWQHVLMQALIDTFIIERNNRSKNIKCKALHFFSKDNLFFLKLCEILDYDPIWLLQKISNLMSMAGVEKLQRATLAKMIGKQSNN